MQRLGKYEIISELGRGGMGKVYKARDPLIDRPVALKTITGNLAEHTDLLERFYQEARSAGTLQHPNIVTIYELGEENGTPFIAMEYLEGETLEQVIARKAVLPLFVKLGYIVRVGEALDYAHSHGVIHRDIKPANIMVTTEGVVKVVDFGIARVMNTSMTQPNLLMGSRAYMAPELYRGERADARSDIWALGATFYELLAFEKPFPGSSDAELMYKVLNENPPPLRTRCSEFPESLESIVGRMLEKSAARRMQSAGDVLRDLGALWRQERKDSVDGLLKESRRLIEAHDLHSAQNLIRKALQIDITNPTAKILLEEVSGEVRRLETLSRVQEHLIHGRENLHAGRIAEARREVESALRLDPQCEPAKLLKEEAEGAARREEELEEKLRLAKQKLVEGALTEAEELLKQAGEFGVASERVQALSAHVASEKARREQRKRLDELLDHARGLWMDLRYEDCLKTLEEGLKEFPGQPKLLKLRETAKQDWADEIRQRRLNEARKLWRDKRFAEARTVLDELANEYPQDAGVKSLRNFVEQGETEQRRQGRFRQELENLRRLITGKEYGEAVAKGEELLREYSQEVELKEVVGYAKGEFAQQQRREKERERERRIRELLQAAQYAEAALEAQRAVSEFAGHEGFQKLLEEANQKTKEHGVREETHRRIQEIQQEQQKRTLEAAQTLVGERNYEEATRILSDAFATQILQPSHPSAKKLLAQIESLQVTPSQPKKASAAAAASGQQSSQQMPSPKGSAAAPPEFSATYVLSPTPVPVPSVPESATLHPTEQGSSFVRPVERRTQEKANIARKGYPTVREPEVPRRDPIRADKGGRSSPEARMDLQSVWAPLRRCFSALGNFLKLRWLGAGAVLQLCRARVSAKPKRQVVVAGLIAAVVVGIVGMGIPIWRSARNARLLLIQESALRTKAGQLWNQGEPDQSEEIWKQLQALHGALKDTANRQIEFIEKKRIEEQQRFVDGERMLQQDQNNPEARQALQDVVDMHLWHAATAQADLNNIVQQPSQPTDSSKREQELFLDGERLFLSGSYDSSRRRFLDMLNLHLPNSSLQPKAQDYLNKIKAMNDDKKNYEAAMQDLQNEDWSAGQDGFRSIADRHGTLSSDAQKQLEKITAAQNAIKAVEDLIRSHSYRAAKGKLDSMQQWPKSSDRLRHEIASAEQEELSVFNGRHQSLLKAGDVAGLERVQDELHDFSSRAEDPPTLLAAEALDHTLNNEIPVLKKEQSGDKVAFEKAEKDFRQAGAQEDINRLKTDVLREFEQIAQGNGFNSDAAKGYVNVQIPMEIKVLTQTFTSKGKAVVPPISCTHGQATEPISDLKGNTVSCAQLDSNHPLQWTSNLTVDVPRGAKEKGKLPYTLRLIVVVDGTGKVTRLDPEGPADRDFLKNAKDASPHWKTTTPFRGGKPVNASFPIEVIFQP